MIPLIPSDDALVRVERPTILVGTRDPETLRRVRELLGDTHDLAPAEDTDAVRSVSTDRHPVAAIVDLATFPSWGLEACAVLRDTLAGQNIPVVVIVRGDNRKALREAYDRGAMDFVIPPLDTAALGERLRFVLRSAQKMTDAHQSRRRLARVQRVAHLGSWVRDLATGSFSADAEVLQIFELDAEDPAGTDLLDRIEARVDLGDREKFSTAMRSGRPHKMDYRVSIAHNGQDTVTRTVQQEAWLTQDEANGDVRLIGTALDVTELKDTQARVARMAYVDSLTGLPNRAFLHAHMQLVLAHARRNKHQFAVMMLDLDMFKRINDTLGHAGGDVLLTAVAKRVAEAVRASDVVVRPGPRDVSVTVPANENTVARLGGDEFTVLLNEISHPEDAAVVARRILESVGQPLDIQGTRIFPACSIGIAVYPDNGDTPEQLLKQADTALYHVKEQGRRSFHFFSEALTQRAHQRLKIEVGLREALAESKFTLHFQPRVRLGSHKITGVEALVRWPAADQNSFTPDEFVPIAEDIGLGSVLGQWVLRAACAQAAAWQRVFAVPLPVAVNVSARQLNDPHFESIVAEALTETGLSPALLELEVTEVAMLKDVTASAAILTRIKARGVSLAIDDFGTGYSSLSVLTRLPVDTLKIDRTFVRELGAAGAGDTVVMAILALAKALSLRVVAEGVETTAHAEALMGHGCDEGQGYLYAPPMPAEACEAWITAATTKYARGDRARTL